MNLADLTDYVTSKTGLVELQDIAAARKFISKRYELIYNSYLWKDALVGVDVAFDPVNNLDNAEGIILLPEVIDRVVAARIKENSLRIHGLEDYYRIDFDQFSNTGRPAEFALLSPIWSVWRGKNGLKVVTADGDKAVNFKIKWRDENGKENVQSVQNGSLLKSVAAADTKKIIVNCPVLINNFQVTGTYTYVSATLWQGPNSLQLTYDANQGKWFIYLNSHIVSMYLCALASDGSAPVGTWVNDALGNPLPTPPVSYLSVSSRLEIETFFKPPTGDVVSLTGWLLSEAGSTLLSGDTRSPAYQRIRLIPNPTSALTVSVLGKKKFVPLDFDQEEPAIKNLDNCLIAFGEAALLEYGRQYAKAAAKMQEAGILLQELAKLETVQAAHNSRFVPEDGFGSDSGFAQRRGRFF